MKICNDECRSYPCPCVQPSGYICFFEQEAGDVEITLNDPFGCVPGEVCPNEYQEPFCLDCPYCDSCKKECENNDL